MVIDLTCSCEAAFLIDTEDSGYEGEAWLLTMRFATAHEGCGFIAPTVQADGAPERIALGPMDQAEVDTEAGATSDE